MIKFKKNHYLKSKRASVILREVAEQQQCYIADKQDVGVRHTILYLLYILQSARVWFQGGGVLHHFVHCDDQEDEIELSDQSNGSVNT